MEIASEFKKFFRNFIESLPYGVLILNTDGNILELNRNISFMLNILGLDPVNSHYSQVLGPSLKSSFDRLLEGVKEHGFVLELEVPLSVGAGAEVVMSLSGSFLQSEDGQHNEIVVVCREMSARQEIERMKELEKLKTDFMSSITHDLKAPLTSIIGYADLILETSGSKMQPEEVEYITIIKQEGVRLTRMINDILNATRIEYGKLVLSPEQALLKSIVEEVVKKFAIHKDRFTFTITADGELPQLWLDRELIERVFMNLVSNAVKYSPGGGLIKIDIYTQGQNVRADVIDNGIGLSQESLSHVFEKFFRVKSEATKGIGGTGLGLVIAKGIVEAHGGSMTISSTHGQGSIFSVILPLSLARHKP